MSCTLHFTVYICTYTYVYLRWSCMASGVDLLLLLLVMLSFRVILCLQRSTFHITTCQEVSLPSILAEVFVDFMIASLTPYPLSTPLPSPLPSPPLLSPPCAVPEGIYMLETLRRVNVSHNMIRELSSLVGEWAMLLCFTREFL